MATNNYEEKDVSDVDNEHTSNVDNKTLTFKLSSVDGFGRKKRYNLKLYASSSASYFTLMRTLYCAINAWYV